MGIWSEARIICGCRIDIYPELLEYLKQYDPEFIVNFTDDPNHGDDEVYNKTDKCGLQFYDIRIVINRWLKSHFPDIRIAESCPIYDCDHDEKRYYLAFKLSLSQIGTSTSISEAITSLNNLCIDNYKKVFEILFPEEEYSEPKIFAVAYIW